MHRQNRSQTSSASPSLPTRTHSAFCLLPLHGEQNASPWRGCTRPLHSRCARRARCPFSWLERGRPKALTHWPTQRCAAVQDGDSAALGRSLAQRTSNTKACNLFFLSGPTARLWTPMNVEPREFIAGVRLRRVCANLFFFLGVPRCEDFLFSSRRQDQAAVLLQVVFMSG